MPGVPRVPRVPWGATSAVGAKSPAGARSATSPKSANAYFRTDDPCTHGRVCQMVEKSERVIIRLSWEAVLVKLSTHRPRAETASWL